MSEDQREKEPCNEEAKKELPDGRASGAGETGQGQSGMPMFRPSVIPPGVSSPPSLEPGLIEIEFKDHVRPELPAPTVRAPMEVRSTAGHDLSELNQLLQRHGLQKADPTFRVPPGGLAAPPTPPAPGIQVPNLSNFVTLQFPPDADVHRIAQELNQLQQVARAVPVPKAIPPQNLPDDPLVGTSDKVVLDPITGLENQWYLFRCRADRAWSLSSGQGVVVADIDWGYRISHQDLNSRLDLTHAHNSFDGGTNVSHGASVMHGTGVVGLAGGARNQAGMVGFAFEASLWPIQANSGPGSQLPGDSWANGIEWVRAADSGGRRKVIILEVQTGAFGNYEMVPSVNAAIRLAIASGITVCVAAGNGDKDAGIDDYGNPIPATGSILVGATAYDPNINKRADFSNFGSRIVVSAPGDAAHDVTCSNSADDSYSNPFGGTSGATPKVAGTVALMLAANSALSHAEIRDILSATGTPITTEAGKPVGTFLNAEAAVREAQRQAIRH